MKRNSTAIPIIWLTLALCVIWLALGLYLFVFAPTLKTEWARGEVGDFVGGGVGALAILLIAYTVLIQQRQIAEERVFRTIELLKPELENLSARIVAKARDTEAISTEHFEDRRERFEKLDRTVFFREIQKQAFQEALEHPAVAEASIRFLQVVSLIDESLESLGGAGNAMKNAVRAMDFYRAKMHLEAKGLSAAGSQA
ncbi:MAG: hypothetical protein ACMVY4_17480 [Minwuia sp.]|uniref:hypothetical protein n=1 Tax=Minwuia sp. TaxID=2493630 RepID=UPI003A83FD33